jgi:hypothetical protein
MFKQCFRDISRISKGNGAFFLKKRHLLAKKELPEILKHPDKYPSYASASLIAGFLSQYHIC